MSFHSISVKTWVKHKVLIGHFRIGFYLRVKTKPYENVFYPQVHFRVVKLIFIWKILHETRFENEAQGNSKMVYDGETCK